MSRSYEVEYCNLELRFDRRRIQSLISDLIEEGYSLYWNENDRYFMISIRSGRKLIKLKFERTKERFKLVGNYTVRDPKLAELIEKMIGDTRGHAVVKRFIDEQILIENIMFGEIIRTVEINGVKQKVLFEKDPAVSAESVARRFAPTGLNGVFPYCGWSSITNSSTLHDLLQNGASEEEIEACKKRLEQLRQEWLLTEA